MPAPLAGEETGLHSKVLEDNRSGEEEEGMQQPCDAQMEDAVAHQRPVL